jgi:hypothetical protein
MTRSNWHAIGCIVFIFWIINACAFDLAHIKFDPVQIKEFAGISRSFSVQEDTDLTSLPCRYSRKLRKNSKWECIGTIDQGEVYKPINQCFTLECSNVYEAFLVIQNDNLIGFYLPVEKGYNSLKTPIPLSLSR